MPTLLLETQSAELEKPLTLLGAPSGRVRQRLVVGVVSESWRIPLLEIVGYGMAEVIAASVSQHEIVPQQEKANSDGMGHLQLLEPLVVLCWWWWLRGVP